MKKATLIAAVAALALSTGAATAQNRPKYTVRQGHVERFATPALPSDTSITCKPSPGFPSTTTTATPTTASSSPRPSPTARP